MKRSYRVFFMLMISITIFSMLLTSCAQPTAATQAPQATAKPGEPTKAPEPTKAAAPSGAMTDVGTPRNQTLVVQTFDRKSANPDQHNYLMSYDVWRGVRELCMGFLWETDTGKGVSYPEIADGMPEVLNKEYTQFRIKLRKDLKWSDGVAFNVDDVIYTFDTYSKEAKKLTDGNVAVVNRYVKSWKKVDDFTFEVETNATSYDLPLVLGVTTWASAFKVVPKHIFEKQADVSTFRNTYPVCLGPYTLKEFDPNGYWALWQKRDDWKNSSWGWYGEPAPKYVLYKDFGTEDKRVLSFIQNQYDIDTFMGPDSIKAAQAKSTNIETFNPLMPYHNMDDACQYGILMNDIKAPYDKLEVRWALALAMDLKSVGINALSGEFKAAALPMVDTPILRPLYYEPMMSFLNDLTLADGYKPFDANFAKDLAAKLKTMGAKNIPETEKDIKDGFGLGWWKYDTAQAEKLLTSVGMKRGSDKMWQLPDGKTWEMNFIIPGDWNGVLQRLGFSIADSWTKFGIKVNTKQLDQAGWSTAMNTNAQLETLLNWTPNCAFVPVVNNTYRGLLKEYVQKDPNATDLVTGNLYRFANDDLDAAVKKLVTTDPSKPEYKTTVGDIQKIIIKNMAYIGMMNIPTTIPTNNYYWTNYPKQNNYYAEPYSWWSSFKMILQKVKPTGK
jgi:peptide/nickel transport system substrate-binding protein